MQDIESDFWKEIFTHLQHRNMSRLNAERLTLKNIKDAVKAFSERNPSVLYVVEDKGSYVTFETEVTAGIKFRLFVQNQIKASLIQEKKGEQVKIADAKFPNDPFSELELLLQNKDRYVSELSEKLGSRRLDSMKDKITLELILSLLKKRFPVDSSFNITKKGDSWNIEILSGQKKSCAVFSAGSGLELNP